MYNQFASLEILSTLVLLNNAILCDAIEYAFILKVFLKSMTHHGRFDNLNAG